MASQEMVLDDMLIETPVAETDTTVERLVAAAYPHRVGTAQIRRLWSRGHTQFCRVNWWRHRLSGESQITHSAFIAIEQTPAGLQLREISTRTAA
ncbi:MAG: hypothetical protein SF069_00760 [Phycisphaerae bacterium]|nr:hypothetical protein [Phycisphaerae bacterium]